MKRTATSTIWKTVVFAGAMLAAPIGCTKSDSTASTMPENRDVTATPDEGDDPCAGDPCAGDPCGDRWDGDPCEGGVGRGFVLS
jgi:hypothetical protein